MMRVEGGWGGLTDVAIDKAGDSLCVRGMEGGKVWRGESCWEEERHYDERKKKKPAAVDQKWWPPSFAS